MKASSSASNSSSSVAKESVARSSESHFTQQKAPSASKQQYISACLLPSAVSDRGEVRWCLSFFYQSTVFSLNEVLSMFREPSYKIYKITKWNCKKKIDQKMRPIVVAFVVQSCLSLTSTVHSVQNNVPQQSQAFSSGIKKLPDIYWNTTNPM